MVFPDARLPKRLPDFVSTLTPLPNPTTPRPRDSSRVIYLITETDIRRHVLSGKSVADLCGVSLTLKTDNITSARLHEWAKTSVESPVRLWRVGGKNDPVRLLPNDKRAVPSGDLTVFAEPIRSTPARLPSAKVAFISFFFPNATPKVQFLTATAFDPKLPVSQLFPLIRESVGLGDVGLTVFSLEPAVEEMPEDEPIRSLDWIQGSMSIVVEAVGSVETNFPVDFAEETHDPCISYFSKIRPGGDASMADFIERRRPQVRLEIRTISNPEHQGILATVPETMPLMELHSFVVFATQEHFNDCGQSIELYIGEPTDELFCRGPTDVPIYSTAGEFFGENARSKPVRIFYAIVPCPTQCYPNMQIRTCDVYDTAIHRLR
jgi:hypothetical protein